MKLLPQSMDIMEIQIDVLTSVRINLMEKEAAVNLKTLIFFLYQTLLEESTAG